MSPALTKQYSLMYRYLLVSFILSLCLLSFFYSQIPQATSNLSYLTLISLPLYYYFAIFIISTLLSPLLFTRLKYLIILPKVILDIFLLADIAVFYIYNFHIDMIFIKMVIFDFRGIGISPSMIALVALSVTAIFLINVFIFKIVTTRFHINLIITNVVLFLLLFAGQGLNAWAEESRQSYITKYTPYFPYYAPLTANSFIAEKRADYPSLIPLPEPSDAQQANLETSNSDEYTYPINPVTFNSNKPTTNVLFIVLESWQAAMLTPEVMPNLSAFKQSNFNFENHFSNGSVTVSGLFSLMYGLNPTYLTYAQSEPLQYQTLLTKGLEQQDYKIDAYTTTNLSRFSLKPLFFGNINDDNFNYYNENSPHVNDADMVDKMIADLDASEKSQPWFKFIFMNSSHHSYDYPVEFTKFTPTPEVDGAYMLNKNIDAAPFVNDYKNSLYYLDSLFEKINKSLKANNLYDNTIVVITGDHAEEFNDNKAGYWGHGSNFTKFQTQVPLLIHTPENKETTTITRRSAHVDIVPTILTGLLKSETKISDYSDGFDLFNLPKKRNLIQQSYKSKSYLIDDTVYSTGVKLMSYDINDIKNKNEDFQYSEINKMKLKEGRFLSSSK